MNSVTVTLELQHRGEAKRVDVRLDPVPETWHAHHRRPDQCVMRLRTEAGRHSQRLVAHDIALGSVLFHAGRLLDFEADRKEAAA